MNVMASQTRGAEFQFRFLRFQVSYITVIFVKVFFKLLGFLSEVLRTILRFGSQFIVKRFESGSSTDLSLKWTLEQLQLFRIEMFFRISHTYVYITYIYSNCNWKVVQLVIINCDFEYDIHFLLKTP